MLDIENILLVITALINAGLVLFIYSRNRTSRINKSFALFVLFLAFWALVILLFRQVEDGFVALYALKLSYISALLIGACFYYFSLVFPQDVRPSRLHTAALITSTAALAGLVLLPDFLTKGVVEHEWGREVTLGMWEYIAFAALFSYFFIGGQLRIWLKFFLARGFIRTQLLYIGFSVTVIGLIGMYYNLVLPSPFYQDFRYVWTGPIFTFFFATVITYAIFRYRLFNPKAVLAELLVFGLWLFILIRTLLTDEPFEQILNVALLVVVVGIGLLLIRSVNREIETRERIEKLAKDLENANARLKELDRQKTEFVSIASHQLRSPLTAIKGYASLLVEGSFGKLTAGALDAAQKIFSSSQYMALSIEDFLNVSRIELGTVKYDKRELDLRKLCTDTVAELAPAANEKGLHLSCTAGESEIPVLADIGKMKQVIMNLVDNSLKYTPKGSVRVAVRRDGSRRVGRIEVVDTGVGIPPEVIPKLFEKFSRAKNANEVNVMGTGLGLFVAKQFVQAHGGRIWAESAGQGKGSTFIVELPLLKA